jgi:hypothetical protein
MASVASSNPVVMGRIDWMLPSSLGHRPASAATEEHGERRRRQRVGGHRRHDLVDVLGWHHHIEHVEQPGRWRPSGPDTDEHTRNGATAEVSTAASGAPARSTTTTPPTASLTRVSPPSGDAIRSPNSAARKPRHSRAGGGIIES